MSKPGQDARLQEDFSPSQLGTKEYWDDAYQRELDTFRDIGDVGEIWFGEESMARVLRWLDKKSIPTDSAVLDIGTGNGLFLIRLAEHGFTNLTGIDYSAASVELAKCILEKEGLSGIRVKEMDFLSCPDEFSGFNLCIDKGTFDAITLNADGAADCEARYTTALRGALRVGGLFVITSCNWTKEQLLNIFSHGFRFHEELPTPRFQFGGKTGNAVTVLIFERIP
ncbi:EEF1A lysine methyltransferase 2 [Scleropages formosus]|uniref:EEF1A lysine methyltransferase 2 n=1 Tax=Scleropages formosus TaxID=113540 RepID=A0A8C9RKM5_SCLFO|nr:EEF1A lysine methyltransferase 2 [Scleropages formosus]